MDIGCGKGFLLFEIKKLLPNIKITGIDISKHAIECAPKEISKYLSVYDATKKLNFEEKSFNLTISINTMHNFKIFDLIMHFKCQSVSKLIFVCRKLQIEEELFNLEY